MLTGMSSTEIARSVPWSRLNPRRKYWLALAVAAVLGDDQAGHDLERFGRPGKRSRVDVIAADILLARRRDRR
jgi:hypothetical protein